MVEYSEETIKSVNIYYKILNFNMNKYIYEFYIIKLSWIIYVFE